MKQRKWLGEGCVTNQGFRTSSESRFWATHKYISRFIKVSILTFLVIFLLLIFSTLTFASGWNFGDDFSQTIDSSPHGIYSNANNCKTCHGSHGANVDSYRLLRNTSRDGECDYCHAFGGVSGKIIQKDDISTSEIEGGAHGIHLSSIKGPKIYCYSCHSTHPSQPLTILGSPEFKDRQTLNNTTACNQCHSQGGAFNGVNSDSNSGSLGAKDNWWVDPTEDVEGDSKDYIALNLTESQIYDAGGNLKSGKDKWCVGCHDDDPNTDDGNPDTVEDNESSLIQDVNAPSIAGDNLIYGFYKTGHGKQGIVNCTKCHNSFVKHIDGEQRTYIASSNNYQDAYRLKYSMKIPFPTGLGYDQDKFELCFKCHNYQLVIDSDIFGIDKVKTNFRDDPTEQNLHFLHISGQPSNKWDSDWNYNPGESLEGVLDSRVSCPACHNVHGSKTVRLTRSGELESNPGKISKVPALDFKWLKDDQSQTVTFSESRFGFMPSTAGTQGVIAYTKVCDTCHNSSDDGKYERTPVSVGSSNCELALCHAATIDSLKTGSHETHFDNNRGPGITSCNECHGTDASIGTHSGHMNGVINFADGDLTPLSSTAVCNTCHSPNGAFNGISDLIIGAKTNWKTRVYNTDGTLQTNKDKWCATCHDDQPSVIKGKAAPDKVGDNSSYGFYVTGHGRNSAYVKMSWQDTTASGNAGANIQSCGECHDSKKPHIDSADIAKRLKDGYENNQSNSNCNNCHPPGNRAVSNPQFYTNSIDYENSAHKNKFCSDCHDVHGSTGNFQGALRLNLSDTTRTAANQYVDLGNNPLMDFDRDDSFSISLWVKFNRELPVGSDQYNWDMIISKMDEASPYRGIQLFRYSDNKIYFALINNFTTTNNPGSSDIWTWIASTTTVSTGGWYNITATYDGSSHANGMKLYIDGQEEIPSVIRDGYNNQGLTGPITNSQPWRIGHRGDSGYFLNGYIDQTVFYNKALSSSEVNDVVNNIPPSSYIGLWNFNEGSGTIANDSGPNNIVGTLIMSPQWEPASTATAMTRANKEDLCNKCHGPAHGGHAIGASFTNDTDGKSYSLACTSCHNIHVLSGRPKDEEGNRDKSAVTLLTDITKVWGDDPLEKMSARASSWGGIYRTPNGEETVAGTTTTLSGDALPDYDTFCINCHKYLYDEYGGQHLYTSGKQDQDSHFARTAGTPSGGNHAPDQYSFGKAFGWDGDNITDESIAWPVTSRGWGEQSFTRPAYNQDERIAGVNFVLSCTDCHVVHEEYGGKIRPVINGGTNSGAGEWKTLCGNCHWFYSVDYLGADNAHSYKVAGGGMKGCGSASCHEFSSIHQAKKLSYSWGVLEGTRTVNEDRKSLVVDMRFDEPNLPINGELDGTGTYFKDYIKDSGLLRLHGRWRGPAWDSDWGTAPGGTGSFAVDRNGEANKAIEINNQPIEVGTRNLQWSTEEGPRNGTTQWGHGTWKYSEMKNFTTLEAWVNPTDDSSSERIIMTKQNMVSDNDLFTGAGNEGIGAGGYRFVLKKVNGIYRAGLQVNVTGGGDFGKWDAEANGWRGAYSSVSIPTGKWTHVAAVFNKDRDDGRVRVYVNGEDVTTNELDIESGWIQPKASEETIFPYSQHNDPLDNAKDSNGNPVDPNKYHKNPWGYEGHWTATPLSIGGYNWSDTGSNFIGKLDNVKLWNIAKDKEPSYFEDIDEQSLPRIDRVEGLVGNNQLEVTFSEEVWGSMFMASNVTSDSLIFSDGSGTTITGLIQTAQDKAMITLSSNLDESDIGTATLAAKPLSVFDDYNNAALTETVLVQLLPGIPVGATTFQLNEVAGSSYIFDDQKVVVGKVNDSAETIGGGYLNGDGSNNFVRTLNGDQAFKASRKMTIEARFKSNDVGSGDNTTNIQRIFARTTGSANYQISIWRNTTDGYPNFNPGDNKASIALWVRPLFVPEGEFTWKPTLTDYTNYAIEPGRWYRVRVIWDSDNVGKIPAEIYIDDQGPDGDDVGQKWTGYVNATNTDQTYLPIERKLHVGDEIKTDQDGPVAIGVDINGSSYPFNGKIDWINWDPLVVRP